MNENESSVSNRYTADMNSIHRDLYDIRMSLRGKNGIEIDARDIADNISAFDIASHIEVDVSDINLRDLADHITDNIEINASDIEEQFKTIHEKIDKIEALLLNKTVSFEPKHKYLEVQID